MAIYVDDIAVDWPGERLGELLATASDRIEPSGRIIVEVVVDGQAIVGDELVERRDETVTDREVRLVTADPTELTLTTLNEVRGGLQSIRDEQERAAELFQKDQSAEALKLVGNVLQSWLHVQEAVLHSARLAQIDLDALDVDGIPVREMTDSLLRQFEQFKEQLTHNDLFAIADALAYEWTGSIDQWDRLLEEMIRIIEERK